MATSRRSSETTRQLPMFLSVEHRASPSPLPVFEKDYPTLAAVLCWPSSRWLHFYARDGLSGRMFPASSLPTMDGLSDPSFQGWGSAGMGGPIEFSTLSISEWPNDANVCSLSDILEETGDVPPRFFLSPRACAGILRRAEKRGFELPETLRLALMEVASRDQ